MSDHVYDMNYGIILIRNMELEKGRYQKIGGCRDVDMAKAGESQLDGTQDK